MNNTCIFCKIIAGSIPSSLVRNDEHMLVIKDIHPKAPVHLLIIPKVHLTDMADPALTQHQLAQHFFDTVQALAQDYAPDKAFNLISNNGEKAGQSVPHLHWHFLAGRNIYTGGFEL